MILSIASIIGTVLKQDDPYPNYVNQFGPFWADIFRALSLYTVYSAWWFMLILGFLWCRVRCASIRNAPKMIADMNSWKDKRARRQPARVPSQGRIRGAGDRARRPRRCSPNVSPRLGYKFVTRESDRRHADRGQARRADASSATSPRIWRSS